MKKIFCIFLKIQQLNIYLYIIKHIHNKNVRIKKKFKTNKENVQIMSFSTKSLFNVNLFFFAKNATCKY